MCGGGTGSANDSSNDNDKGSGNSFKETMANVFTPNDGMSYVDGQLRETSTGNRVNISTPSNRSSDDNRGGSPSSAAPAPTMKQSRITAGITGALTGGLPGLIGGLAVNELSRGKTGGAMYETVSDAGSGLKGLFAEPEFANEAEEKAYREKQRTRRDAMMASMTSNDNDNRFTPAAPAAPTIPTVGGPSSDMSNVAAQGAFQAVPNPNYDPTDPLSPRFLSNPTYDQLLAYRNSQQPGLTPPMPRPMPYFPEPTSPVDFMSNFTPVPGMAAPGSRLQYMAEGGEVMGGNEKTMISDAVSAVKGEMSETEASIVLGQFLANYGEDALRDLVDKVQSGELDDTVDRFAAGEAGAVRGPGDGSGVDDKVPATLEGQQDVLLADGEFVLRKKTADALEKKYGGGFLDAVNEAETDAPRTMREYMAKRA